MPVWCSVVFSIMSFVISSIVAIATVRIIVPKYYDVQERIKNYDANLVVELYNFNKESFAVLNNLLHHYGAEANIINEDFGNGIFYCKVIVRNNEQSWTCRDIRSAIASSDLCARVFITKKGAMHDKSQHSTKKRNVTKF